MSTDTSVTELVINKLTKNQYQGTTPSDTELYYVTDANYSYNDLADKPTVDQIYDSSSANAQSGVAVASAISGKADDNAVVHLAGTETISGEKGFTTAPWFMAGQTVAYVKNNNIDITVTPASNQYEYFDFVDKNDTRIGVVGAAKLSDGGQRVYLQVQNVGNLCLNSDGTNAWVTAPNKIVVENRSINRSSTSPSTNQYANYDFQGKNGDLLGSIYVAHYTDGVRGLIMPLYNNSGGGSNISLRWDSSNGFYTYAPPTDVNNSIVTTVNKSKGSNGYFKLGNGLIIQWGRQGGSGTSRNVTLPTAFTSTNYKAVVSPFNGSPSSTTWSIYNQTTTGFDIHVSGSGSGMDANWIAIGY